MAEEFGTRLKGLRKNAGLTQQQLAEKLNIHERTVSKWERNLCEPDFAVYGLLSEALGVSLEEIWGLSAPSEKINGKFDMLSFGKIISCARKSLDESQDNLANIVGVSANTVSKWERGIVCPDIFTFLKLTEHFGVHPSEFYYSVSLRERVAESTVNDVKNNRKHIMFLTLSAVMIIIAAIVTTVCLLIRGNNKIDPDFPPIIDATEPSCEHNYVSQTVEATCTLQGYVLHTCIECWDSYKSDYIMPTGHTYDYQTVAATCTSRGYELYECTACGNSFKSDYTEKLGHNYIVQTIVETCYSEGYTSHRCTVCDYSYKSDYIPMTDHKYNIQMIEATCSSMGGELYTCIVCGDSSMFSYIPKLEHTYFEEFISSDEDGYSYKLFICTVCGFIYKDYLLPLDIDFFDNSIIQKRRKGVL